MKVHLSYIAIITIVVIIAFYFYDESRKNAQQAKQNENIITEKDAIITYRTNENGRIVAQKVAAELDKKALMKSYPEIVKQIQRDFDTKLKDVKAYINNQFLVQGHGNSIVHNHYYTDSLGVRHSAWEMKASDGYLNFRADVLDSLHAPYRYTYIDTITTVVSSKRKWFLGNERLYSSSELSNKKAKVIKSTNLLVNNIKDKRWIISVGVSYDPFSNTFRPGVSAGYALFKF